MDINKVFAIECLNPARTDIYYRALCVTCATPAVACGFCLLVYYVKLRAATTPDERLDLKSTFGNIILLITFVLFVPVSSTIFGFFSVHDMADGSCHLRVDCTSRVSYYSLMVRFSLCLCRRFHRLFKRSVRSLEIFCDHYDRSLADRSSRRILGCDVRESRGCGSGHRRAKEKRPGQRKPRGHGARL